MYFNIYIYVQVIIFVTPFAYFLELRGYFMDEAGITSEIISDKMDMKSQARIIQLFREKY